MYFNKFLYSALFQACKHTKFGKALYLQAVYFLYIRPLVTLPCFTPFPNCFPTALSHKFAIRLCRPFLSHFLCSNGVIFRYNDHSKDN